MFKKKPVQMLKLPTSEYSLLFVLALVLLLGGCGSDHAEKRQHEVADRGTEVMPFDLDRTTHIFEKLENGGMQQVLSDDQDADQIQRIQAHLEEEAGRFSQGDFHDPAMIHGHDMPGLHELVMGYDKMSIVYSELENGGQILYTTQDSSMVVAVHTWFDAQLADHGDHAQGHH